jgi:hypothetical protein
MAKGAKVKGEAYSRTVAGSVIIAMASGTVARVALAIGTE